MAAKKTSKDKQTEGKNIEREYTIPLKEGFRQKPIYKKTPAATKTIKKFLVRHMKIRDRDLNKIKINKYLNEYLWFRGIRKPPIKVKVRAVKEDAGTEKEKVRAYLSELPEKLKFKQIREEKLSKKAEKEAEEKKSAKAISEKTNEPEDKEEKSSGSEEKEKKEEKSSGSEEKEKKEKKSSGSEEKEKKEEPLDANIKIAKDTAKKQKHITGGKHKDQTAPKRQALKK